MQNEKQECSLALQNQKGVSLIVSLMILLILTLIGITAISTTTFETNIAGNERLYNRAFYSADAGVDFFGATGSAYIDTIAYPNSTGVVNYPGGLIDPDSFSVEWVRTVTDFGPPKKYEFTVISHGVSPNFPTAGRIDIEAVVEVVDTAPQYGYPGGS